MKMQATSLWPPAIADILGVGHLTERQARVLERELITHFDYIDTSLLPDITRMFGSEGILSGEDFNKFDHRTIFMYAGALWSLGFLATVTFDGVNVRDLADVFMFVGPNDGLTCQGDRGCDQFANKMFTVADILARDIVPGHLQCLTNCRHMLWPVASSLQRATKGGAGSGNFQHSGRPGVIGGSGPGMLTGAGEVVFGKTAQEWFDEQQKISDALTKDVLDAFDKDKPNTEMTREHLAEHLNRLGEHRSLILDEGMQAIINNPGKFKDPRMQDAFLNNLMKHDADKYDYDAAEAYVGSFKIDRKIYEGAFTAVMSAHHMANPHHPEYWVTPQTKRAAPIPPVYFWEMMADWKGTARERGMPYSAYYRKFGNKMILHPQTREAVERELYIGPK